MINIDPLIIAFLGVFLGVGARTILPYIRKLKEAKEQDPPVTLVFDLSYLGTAIFALFVTIIVSMLVFPAFTAMPEVIADPLVFILAFQFGWSCNDQINELIA